MKTPFQSALGLFLALSLYLGCYAPRSASTGIDLVDEQANKTTAITRQELSNQDAGLTMADLFSRVPGVTVFGSDRNLRIMVRGQNSINQSSEPLFVVDGQIMGSGYQSVDFLEPSMIKSISVLKDGASSAAYGSRGLNGIIVINLKKN